MKTVTPEDAAVKFAKLLNAGEAGSFRAEMFRRQYEERAGEQDYEDFRSTVAGLDAYGVC